MFCKGVGCWKVISFFAILRLAAIDGISYILCNVWVNRSMYTIQSLKV